MRRVVLVLAALAAAACDQPPVKEITAAEQQVANARAAGAERYAPERMKQAEAALATARQQLKDRDYRGALSAANDAAESARIAVEASGPAKSNLRRGAEGAIVEVRGMLDRARVEREAAVKAGVPRATLAPLDDRGQLVSQKASQVTTLLEVGHPDYIKELLADLRTQVTPLPDLYRDARTQWEAKHPKPRPHPPARHPRTKP